MPITDEQLNDIIKATGLKRAEIAALCGVGTQAPGWWRFKGRMPVSHFKTLSAALEKKLKHRKELTPLEQRAASFCQIQLVGSTGPNNSRKSSRNGSRPLTLKTSEKVVGLGLISLEALIQELGRRGGTVTFHRKKIVVR